MSKPLKPFFVAAIVFVHILQFLNNSYAQTPEISIAVDGSGAHVIGNIPDAPPGRKVTNFSLADAAAGQTGLAARHSEIELAGRDGKPIDFKTLAPGEILASSNFDTFRYKSDLKPLSPTAMAHVSWLAEGRGILMGADLLPRLTGKTPAVISFALPAGWEVVSNETRIAENTYRVSGPETAVFFVGKDLRTLETPDRTARLVINGEFLFSDSEAAKMTGEILERYRMLFGSAPAGGILAGLIRYPKGTRFGRWEAETRGATLMIMSADMPFSTQSVQKLHEQLRHELFHLWVPNGLDLSGDYDWFYEGFALYQSLRTAVALNRIRFEDFLDTLARAYDADSMLSSRKSLIEASRSRWAGSNTQVYARGMLVAFLIDLSLLAKSKGKNSVEDVLRAVYRGHRLGKPREDGNTAILRVIESDASLKTIAANYIRGAEAIVWRTELSFAGIEVRTENFSTKLTVKAKPSRRQKDLLDELGYNNWRNFLKSSK
ncbi:MAG: hypothetical protein IPJ30_21705 [Acidobacteria bacterium]|nr:hypothetical protein [Acidobacteriota bacterium]